MDIYRDELRRQLNDTERAHRAALSSWREALRRTFSDEGRDLAPEAKAQLLGVPSPGRRQLFRIGGATVLGAAVLAACGDDDNVANTGTTDATSAPESSTTTAADASGDDVVLLRTATSLELLAVSAYQTAIDSGLVTTPAVGEAAKLFQQQHAEHAAQLQSATEDLGGERYAEPNAYLLENVVQPAVPTLTDELKIVAFAHSLEKAAAQTYTFGAGVLSTPELRAAIMAIGGVEARHVAVLAKVLGQPQVPDSFLPTTEAIPEDAFVS